MNLKRRWRIPIALVLSLSALFALYVDCTGSGFQAKSSSSAVAANGTIAGGGTQPGGGGSTGGSGGTGGGSGSSPSGAATCGSNNPISAASFYPCATYFNMPVTNAATDPNSAKLIAALQSNGAWGGTPGNPHNFGITGLSYADGDPGIDVYYTNDPVTSPVSMAVDLSNTSATNDPLPFIPIPSGGSTKGFEDGDTTCSSGGDCHYIVMDLNNQWEVDAYQGSTNPTTNVFSSGGGTAIWPFTPPSGGWYQTLRGNGCTSADATGLPIGPLLFSVEEIAAGQINHAIRFILNNEEIAHLAYVFPGTHTTYAASASPGSGMPYGAWLRLRPDYPVSSLPCGTKGCAAQVIAKALQTYGMILADGGTITLTAKSDTYSSVHYTDYFSASGFSHDLSALQPSDFAVIQPPGVPTGMPTSIPSVFGGQHTQIFLEPISTIASSPTTVPDLTCYRNFSYSYLSAANASVTNPPSATASEWSSSESGCGSVTNLMQWLSCQISQGNN